MSHYGEIQASGAEDVGMGVGREAASPGSAQTLIPQQHQMATANLHQLNLLPF